LKQLFALVPDLHADVRRVAHGQHDMFIEFTLSGTYGGKPISWAAVDRFTFANGLIAERVSYFDSTPLVVKLVGRPSGWNRLVRTGAQLFKRCRVSTRICAGPGCRSNRTRCAP
jgi:hypothetical protein